MVLTNENIDSVPLDGDHARVIVLGEDAQMTSEDKAMLCALYSRSNASVISHLSRVKKAGSSKFMSQYYVGYGHASIADCGNVYVFFENVSIVAAMCLNNFELFNGQECSTRYINFSGDNASRVVMSDMSRAVYEDAMNFTSKSSKGDDMSADQFINALFKMYDDVRVTALTRLKRHLRNTNAELDLNSPAVLRAVEARAFDIARGWLPAGVKTNVALVCSLRKAREHMMLLTTYPHPEVRVLAREALWSLHEAYPSSFEAPTDENINGYCERHGLDGLQIPEPVYISSRQSPAFSNGGRQINARGGSAYSTTFAYAERQAFDRSRERVEDVTERGSGSGYDRVAVDSAHFFESIGSSTPFLSRRRARTYSIPGDLFPLAVVGVLDYGSYRDLARHRTLYKGHVSPFMQRALSVHADSADTDEVIAKFYKYEHFTSELGMQLSIIDSCLYDGDIIERQHSIEHTLRRLSMYASELLDYVDLYDQDATDFNAYRRNMIEKIVLLDYFAPLAMPVQVSFVTMPAHLSYFIDLRSSQAVHPTLRKFVSSLANSLSNLFEDRRNFHALVPDAATSPVFERTEVVWLPRGNHTIIKKDAE